ncbi:hypothetical protein H6F44_13940 [Pseudanabaena sp. FACHB-1277]|uniref:Uncharacterized protein n=1 Tax=Pseudanabaena cinerea FACHB-1277 TaxID=2949581 RepID=A0A926UUY4_9CYAN|nr:hypothetical protein [Pseudanabaena cinerea]MBD2151213.1 hypothetical protein [Pseudanabaena cinerea FACHB-1277]
MSRTITLQHTHNINQRSPLISIKKRSPKISILSTTQAIAPNKPTTSNSDHP